MLSKNCLCVNKAVQSILHQFSQLIQKSGISDNLSSRIQAVNIKSLSQKLAVDHGKAEVKLELDFRLKTVDANSITEVNEHAHREYSSL